MKMIIELDRKLVDGEILICENGKIHSVEIHELLPELKRLKEIDELREKIEVLEAKVKELRGEDE